MPRLRWHHALRDLNDGVAQDDADGDPLQFLCECGAESCGAWIELTVDDFRDLRARHGFVLAEGHVPASAATRTRYMAVQLREEARALREQARLQIDRANRVVGRH